MLSRHLIHNKKGGSLVEIVVVAGIIMGSLAAILGLAAFFLTTSQLMQQTGQATALAQEALEIVRNVRDGAGWSAIPAGGPYRAEQSGGAWTLAAGAETIAEFTREIQFEEVCRDSNNDIATCPASGSDSDTVQATATVTWQERGRTHEVELISYFTNWNQ